MKNSIITAVVAAGCSIVFSAQALFAADSLTLKGKKPVEGTFQSFKNDRFHFQPSTGKKAPSEHRSLVDKLVVDPPAKATVIQTKNGKKKSEEMKVKGYEKSNFTFDSEGKEISLPATQVSSIELGLDFDRVGNGETDTPGPAAAIVDIKEMSAWMKENTPTDTQTKAFEHYKTARTSYDSFITENTALVKAMDKTTGPAREEFLNKLRKRKNDEQTLLGELKKAEAELISAFPELRTPAPKK